MPDSQGRSLLKIRDWAFRLSLATIWLCFAQAHVVRWYQTGDARGIGAIAVETVVAATFLVRRAPTETSGRVVAWIATVVGTFGPLLLRPTDDSGGAGAAL